jgi:hypothetical protein
MLRLIAISFCLLATCTMSAAAPPKASLLRLPDDKTSVEIPLYKGGNLLLADVRINGRDAGYFLIDTGAAITVIDRAVARRLKLPSGGQLALSGVAGTQPAARSRVETLQIGSAPNEARMAAHEVVVADLSDWKSSLGPRFGGVLGGTLWNELPLEIDYFARRLTFFSRPQFVAPDDSRLVSLKWFDGRPAIASRIAGRRPVYLLLDTGHQGGLDVTRSFAEAHRDVFDHGSRPRQPVTRISHGIGGETEKSLAKLKRFDLFGRRLSHVPVTWNLDATRREPRDLAGMIGGRELRNFRLTFDYRTNRLWTAWNLDSPVRAASGKRVDINARDFVGDTPVLLAVRNQDSEALESLIRAGAEVDTFDAHGFSALRIAAELGDARLTGRLIEAGAHVDAEGGHPQRPLMIAAAKGHVAVVRLLLAAGADPLIRGGNGTDALMAAAAGGHTTVVPLLLKAGANVHAKTVTGVTALQLARHRQLTAMVRMLRRSGARK